MRSWKLLAILLLYPCISEGSAQDMENWTLNHIRRVQPDTIQFRRIDAKKVSYCDLFTNYAFNNSTVETIAILYIPPIFDGLVDASSQPFLYAANCNNPDAFAVLETGGVQVSEFVDLIQLREKAVPLMIPVKLKGGFRLAGFSAFGELGNYRAEFKVESLKRLKPITKDVVLPLFDGERLVTRVGNKLRDVTNGLAFFYFGSSNHVELKKNVSFQTAEFFLNGQKSLFIESRYSQPVGNIIVRINSITSHDDKWVVEGEVYNKLGSSATIKLSLTATFFVGENDDVILRDFRLQSPH